MEKYPNRDIISDEICTILIPTFNPDECLEKLVYEIIDLNKSEGWFPNLSILLVDDGSTKAKSLNILSDLKETKNLEEIKHDRNYGKGWGIKTGLKYLSNNNIKYIVTADADGQHVPRDILRVLSASIKEDDLVLGIRDFSNKKIPIKSLIGNNITSMIFYLVTGKKLADTQTGLRAFPERFFEDFINIPGDRYEYELNVLLNAKKYNEKIHTIYIDTIYIDNNKKSLFRPILDSIIVYSVFIKYSLTAMIITVSDFLAIYFVTKLFPGILYFLVVRIITSHVYFFVMKNKVFKVGGHLKKQILKYYILLLLNIIITSTMFYNIYYLIEGSFFTSYLLVQFSMFFINFYLQKTLIFKEKKLI
jgi:hypothetical protein